MSASMKSNLNESWIINDTDDGEISWAEDSETSDLDDKVQVKQKETPIKHSKPTHPPVRSGKSHITAAEPEFIMPSARGQAVSMSPTTKQRYQTRTPARDSYQTSRTVNAEPVSVRRAASPAGDKAARMAMSTIEYVFDILFSTLRTLKKPISWILAAYLFAGLLVLVQNLLFASITSALTPICRIPGVSLLHLSICNSPYTSPEHPSVSKAVGTTVDPEFDALMKVQGKFETILEDSASGVTLPMDMKRSEISIRDLRQVVRFSSIPSKNELLHEFDGFIETARIASYDLQRFNSHVGRAVDSVLSTARWTQRVLDDISQKSTQSNGLIPSFIQNSLLAPFQPLQFSESRLLDQYITHTRLISGEIETLIEEAQALLLVLTNLEDRLDIIHGISVHDNVAAKASKDEVLGELWTFFGGNQARLSKVDNQLRLLSRVGEYRKLAYAHVAGTVLKLQLMESELEELRTRVGSAGIAQDRGIQGPPLNWHIENIRLGVERLETQREKARQIEKSHVRNVIDRAAANDADYGNMKTVEGKILIDGPGK